MVQEFYGAVWRHYKGGTGTLQGWYDDPIGVEQGHYGPGMHHIIGEKRDFKGWVVPPYREDNELFVALCVHMSHVQSAIPPVSATT